MNFITIALLAFVVLEFLNVIILYFAPESDKGNGLGVFKAFEKSKEIPEVHRLVKYLVNWVAGTKLIFIALLLVIVFRADDTTQYISVFALVLSILSFFWRLFPLIKTMDKDKQIQPAGYSKTLGWMIVGMVLVFVLVLILTYLNITL